MMYYVILANTELFNVYSDYYVLFKLSVSSVFIARQYGMHAGRDIVLANPSVRLSVLLSFRHTVVSYLYLCERRYHQTLSAFW